MVEMRQFAVLLAFLGVAASCDEDDPVRHLDGGLDAPLIDAAVQPVTLTITVNGAPRQGVVVHFQNADSSLVATEMTDATGKVSRVMGAGGYVTAVDPFAIPEGTNVLRTFANVKPGDQLKLAPNDPGSVTMNVTLPVQGDPAIARYIVDGSCMEFRASFMSNGSGFQPTGPLSFRAGCTTTDMIAVSLDANKAVVGYFVVTGQAITANGTLDYSTKSYSAPTSRAYTLNNVPADLNMPIVYQHILTPNGELVVLDRTTSGGSPTSTATIGVPSVTNGISLVEVNASTSTSDHNLYDWAPLSTTPFVTDVGARKLVELSNPSYSAATHTASWTEGTGGAPDLVYLTVSGRRTTTPNNFNLTWQLIGPHAAGATTFPTIPVGAVDFNFDADDVVGVSDLVLARVAGGYEAIRANAFVLDAIVHDGEVAGLATTATGSVSLVRYLQPLARMIPTPTTIRHRVRR